MVHWTGRIVVVKEEEEEVVVVVVVDWEGCWMNSIVSWIIPIYAYVC